MPPSVSKPRHRRPANRRPTSNATRTASAISPTPLDRRRYSDFSSGLTPAEIAARENVRVATVERSLDIMRTYVAQYSQSSAEMEIRRVAMDRLPDATQVFIDALRATMKETRMEVRPIYNPATGETDEREVMIEVEVPDHAMRMKAVERLEKLLLSVTPKTPLVQVDARSQFNQQTNHLSSAPISFESLTRQIRAEKGLSIGPGEASHQLGAGSANPSAPVEVDYELQQELAEDAEDEAGDSGDDLEAEDVKAANYSSASDSIYVEED